MKHLIKLNRTIYLGGLTSLALAFGSPIAAVAAQHSSTEWLNAKVEDLSRQMNTLQARVDERYKASSYSSSGNNAVKPSKRASIGRGRNKSRSR